jgi:hypothetical protein
MLPAPKAAPVVIRVTPEARPATIAQASSSQAPAEAPAKPAEPGGVQPLAVQPAAVRSRVAPKPTVAPPSKELSAGDLICGQCGEGNEPVRKFCRRCGNSLATAEVASTSRSRRFLPQRKAKVLAAGERPERGKFSFGTVVRVGSYVVLAVVLIGGIAYGALPQVRDAINSRVSSTVQAVTGNAPRPTPVKAASLTASSAITGHPAARAIDPYVNTYWAASLSTDARPKLTVTFAHAQNVSVMLFISGDTAAEAAEPRPKTLHIVFSNGKSQDITLVDGAKTQQFSINGAQGITGMTIQIMSTYSSTSGKAVALGDVEFFGSQ